MPETQPSLGNSQRSSSSIMDKIESDDESKKKSTIELSLAYTDGYAIIRVQDNGPGIRQGLREEIFNSFMTTKTDGVGLGLNLSRSIAERHLGWLRLVETGVQGSIFELRLPTNQPASMESK